MNKGDYLLAINGVALTSDMNPYQILEQTAGREIYIKVNDKASQKEARSILITPTASERGLRNIDWIEANRKK